MSYTHIRNTYSDTQDRNIQTHAHKLEIKFRNSQKHILIYTSQHNMHINTSKKKKKTYSHISARACTCFKIAITFSSVSDIGKQLTVI